MSGTSSEFLSRPSVTHAYSFRHVMDDCLLLQQLIRHNSLDLSINSFLGMIPSIWTAIPLTLRLNNTILPYMERVSQCVLGPEDQEI